MIVIGHIDCIGGYLTKNSFSRGKYGHKMSAPIATGKLVCPLYCVLILKDKNEDAPEHDQVNWFFVIVLHSSKLQNQRKCLIINPLCIHSFL